MAAMLFNRLPTVHAIVQPHTGNSTANTNMSQFKLASLEVSMQKTSACKLLTTLQYFRRLGRISDIRIKPVVDNGNVDSSQQQR